MAVESIEVDIRNSVVKIAGQDQPRRGSSMKMPKLVGKLFGKKSTPVTFQTKISNQVSKVPIKTKEVALGQTEIELKDNVLTYTGAIVDGKEVKGSEWQVDVNPKYTKLGVSLDAYPWRSLYSRQYYVVKLAFNNGQHIIEIQVKSLALYIAIARHELLTEWQVNDVTSLFYVAKQYGIYDQASFENRLNVTTGGYEDLIK